MRPSLHHCPQKRFLLQNDDCYSDSGSDWEAKNEGGNEGSENSVQQETKGENQEEIASIEQI